MKKINSFDTAYEQYLRVAEKTSSTTDIQEKNLIFRRRINLLSVMEFLLSEPQGSN
jgi:hypothetical protein